MKITFRSARLLFYLLICSCTIQAQKNAALEAFIKTQMQKKSIPGLQIAVVQKGKIALLGSYGLADIQNSISVTHQTLFTINSITKAFTGVAIMQLVEAGKLNLSKPVSDYLDSLPAAWQTVTIQQLLTHTSGIPNIMDNDANMIAQGDEASWTKVQTLPMDFATGEQFSYNQTNYLLLGKIIDKLNAQPFTQFIIQNQLKPVNMQLTEKAGFGDSYSLIHHQARGYTFFRDLGIDEKGKRRISNVFEVFPPFIRTAAGMSSTAGEMAQWIIALQNGKLLKSKNSLAALWKPGILNNGSIAGFSNLLNGYALGWLVVSRTEHPAIASVGGGRSALFIYPNDDLAIVILTNLQGASPESFIDEVAGYYIPEMKASAGFGLSPATKALRKELLVRSFEQALTIANELKKKDADFNITEGELNSWGYKLLEQDKIKEAIEIFKLNAALYPESANTYDSLAEAYETSGNTQLAIKNYKRSLELDPKNSNATELLKKLEKN